MTKLTSHAAYDITYHFTFIPKYRRKKLVGNIKKRLEDMIRFCAQINEFEIVEMNIQPDHVRILLTTKPSYSPSEIMQLVKGGTSNKLRELYKDTPETVWTNSFWADGYFVGTVGQRDLKDVVSYVKNQ